MADVLKFDPVLPTPARARNVRTTRDPEFSFWPEAAQGLWLVSEPPSANLANSEGRVLLEMLIVLGATAAIAFAATLFVGMPPV